MTPNPQAPWHCGLIVSWSQGTGSEKGETMAPTDPQKPELDYLEGEPPNWDEGVARLRIENNFLVGPCPRCGHDISGDLRSIPSVPLAVEGQDVAPAPKRVMVTCNCDSPHHGRPENESGCGASGGVEVQP